MRRRPTHSKMLFPGLLLLALTMFMVPDRHVATLRGAALSALRPLLAVCPRPASFRGPNSASILPEAATTDPVEVLPEWYAEERERIMAEIVRLQSENAKLRRLLPGSQMAAPPPSVGAEVIVRKVLWQNALLGLDRGELDGVRLHGGVLHRGAVAGRIVAVGPRAASMALLTHRGLSIAARLADCRIEGILQGSEPEDGEGRCRLIVVGRELGAKPGEQVVTSGYDGAFPAGLWLGTVLAVKKTGDVQWELSVRPACHENSIETVQILTAAPPAVPWPPSAGKR